MLLSKGYSEGDIVTFKMVNGDEIVAKVVNTEDWGWTVTKPCTVVPSHQGIGLLQSLFTADINTNIDLKREHVMIHSATAEQVQDHYIETTSGIKTVRKGSIITQ